MVQPKLVVSSVLPCQRGGSGSGSGSGSSSSATTTSRSRRGLRCLPVVVMLVTFVNVQWFLELSSSSSRQNLLVAESKASSSMTATTTDGVTAASSDTSISKQRSFNKNQLRHHQPSAVKAAADASSTSTLTTAVTADSATASTTTTSTTTESSSSGTKPKAQDIPPSKEEEAKKNDVSSKSRRNVHWMSRKTFGEADIYAGSWHMSKTTFLQQQSNWPRVNTLESATFLAYEGQHDKIRMSLDWMDYLVEHLSMWWKAWGCPSNKACLYSAQTRLPSYIDRTVNEYNMKDDQWPSSATDATKQQQLSPLHPTIAIVAFRALRAHEDQFTVDTHMLTITSVGATLASLLSMGFGRILLVGHVDEKDTEESVARDIFQLFNHSSLAVMTSDDGQVQGRVHQTDLALVSVDSNMTYATMQEINMPKGALIGLDRAFNGTDPQWTQQWLGNDPEYWKYVYFTEPDLILHSRPSALPSLKMILDQNHIVTPHRLPAIPHQQDAPESSEIDPSLVQSDFKTPKLVNSGDDEDDPLVYCCDEQRGEHRPGRTEYPHCGNFWFQCGTDQPPPKINETYTHPSRHGRLDPYDFIRLSHGTRITTIAGSEHARRCILSSSPCQFMDGTKEDTKGTQ